MRILMLNNEFPPLGGGTGTVNRALLSRFAQKTNLEIDLITSALGRVVEHERFAERIRIIKVPVHNQNIHHSTNRELLTYAARALPLALKLVPVQRYDFCFAWSAVPAGGVAWALRRLTGLLYLVRVCGPDIPGFERRYGALYPILTPAIRATWRDARVVIAKCEAEAAMIRAVDRNTAISLVANGVDLAAFQPSDSILDSGPLRIVCIARLIERKGQHHLIEAVRRLVSAGVEVTLDLVGTGDAQAALAAQVQAAGLTAQVRFAGYVPRERIAEHYAAAHVFALASYNEGMSVATLEAMAAGLPVVVTRTGGTTELVKEEINGLTFGWADVNGLTAHLHRLASDRVLVRRMGTASRMHAASFSWEAATERYMELFERMNLQAGGRLTPAESRR